MSPSYVTHILVDSVIVPRFFFFVITSIAFVHNILVQMMIDSKEFSAFSLFLVTVKLKKKILLLSFFKDNFLLARLLGIKRERKFDHSIFDPEFNLGQCPRQTSKTYHKPYAMQNITH